MPDLTGDSIGVAKPWAEAVWRFLQSVFADEWALIQLGIIIAAYGVALLLSSALTPMFESQIRRIERQPELMRVLIVPLRRLKWIFFALILWGTMALLVRVTWPSRSYLIFVAASLVTAGVAITILSRFIRNRSVANLLAVTAWCIAALNITSLLDETVELLDAAAFSLGEVTISALVIIKGITLLAVLLWLAAITGNFLDRKIRESLELTPTLQVLIGKAIKFALIAAALLFSLSATGIDLTVLTIFSGALGLGIGFGLQKVAANLVSGIIHPARPLDQTWRRDRARRICRLDQLAQGALCLGRHPRRHRAPDPQRGLRHGAGDQLVLHHRRGAAGDQLRRRLQERPAPGSRTCR